MDIQPRRRFGPYRIAAPLGKGGMGEVWRAEDTRIEREVAIKVLADIFADDPERHARFEREARVLGSLNHSNIATLYGLEHIEDRHVLVMELVEGEDLSDRLARGPLPVDDVIDVSLQIAAALEAAHERGIVHRDLKPANVRIRHDGTVKVLDFGLAKAWEVREDDTEVSVTPTRAPHPTAAGVVLGTAAYMSPEQARGKAVDKRSDIWAFGVLLWEMLTSTRLFDGETPSDILAAVLRAEPSWERLPTGTPPVLRRLLRRCLERNPRQRLRDIGEARITLEGALGAAVDDGPVAAPKGIRAHLGWVIAGGLAVVVMGLLGAGLVSMPPREAVVRAFVPPPDGAVFHLEANDPGPVAVSPDGSRLAFSARHRDGTVLLYVRSLDADTARALDGTEGAQYPFWSADGQRLGFFADGRLKKIDVAGGPAVAVCPAPDGKGGSWSGDDIIVFAPGHDTGIHRVDAAGGPSVPLTRLDSGRGEDSHRHPRFLPDGRHFLWVARSTDASSGNTVLLGSLDGGDGVPLLRSPVAAEFAAGHLLYVRDGMLVAQPFDWRRRELGGEPRPLAEYVLADPRTASGVFSVSTTAVLVYQTGNPVAPKGLEWLDRRGSTLEHLGEPAAFQSVSLSPQGTRLAAAVWDDATASHDLWIIDVDGGKRTRFTFDRADDCFPVWSPDGDALVFASDRGGSMDLYRKPLAGAGDAELLLASETDAFPTSWSADGSMLAFFRRGAGTERDLWVLPLHGDREPWVFWQTNADDGAGVFSPDGRWLAFWSEESGRGQVSVAAFPGPGRRWQVTNTSGTWAQWTADASQLIVQQETGHLVAVGVRTRGDSFQVDDETPLFAYRLPSITGPTFAVSPDGDRILAVSADSRLTDQMLHLVVNWPQVIHGS